MNFTAESERNFSFHERLHKSNKYLHPKGSARFWLSGTLALSVFAISCNTPPASTLLRVTPTVIEQNYTDTNLGLSIDEAGFFRAVSQGPKFGFITETADKAKMDCLKPIGDFCISENSPSFKVAINQPMTDFMFRQSGLLNPSLPTRMLITEEWLDDKPGEGTGGYTAIAQDGSDQIIVVSLKAASLLALQDLDKKGLPLDSYFDGAVSYFISWISSHEFAHAGVQTKKLLRPGTSLISNNLLDITHPQIYAFDHRYGELYSKAIDRNLGYGALILGATLEQRVNLALYTNQILQEASVRGLM